MRYIKGQDRTQATIFPLTLDEAISKDNAVRSIDFFVDSLNLKEMGFKYKKENVEGRPRYRFSDLLKLYIYGYMNRTRSSRELEKETHRNIELMWLLGGLTPDHNTISNFRRDNPEAIKKVFHATVQTAQNLNLIGGTIIAGDSVKLRAQNSKKNNYNQAKIDRHKTYIDKKLQEYNTQLEHADEPQKEAIKEKIATHTTRKEGYLKLEQQLLETGETQLSTSDTESKHLPIRQTITEVAYSVQTINDAKHKLIIDYDTTNKIDNHALSGMVQRAVNILGKTDFWVLFDKGYHTGSEIKKCHEMGVTNTLISVLEPSSNTSTPNAQYYHERFIYIDNKDVYICPQNQELKSNGNWYHTKSEPFKQYKTSACKTCLERAQCTKSTNGRYIQRNQSATNVLKNKQNMEQNMSIYKQRQAIVEHPFGTIKRQWGFDHILTKQGKKRASADVGFMFIAYNLRRLLTITKGALRQPFMFFKIASMQHIYSQNKTISKKNILFESQISQQQRHLMAA